MIGSETIGSQSNRYPGCIPEHRNIGQHAFDIEIRVGAEAPVCFAAASEGRFHIAAGGEGIMDEYQGLILVEVPDIGREAVGAGAAYAGSIHVKMPVKLEEGSGFVPEEFVFGLRFLVMDRYYAVAFQSVNEAEQGGGNGIGGMRHKAGRDTCLAELGHNRQGVLQPVGGEGICHAHAFHEGPPYHLLSGAVLYRGGGSGIGNITHGYDTALAHGFRGTVDSG